MKKERRLSRSTSPSQLLITCPWDKKLAKSAPLIALDISQSSNRISGFFPPSSNVTRFKSVEAVLTRDDMFNDYEMHNTWVSANRISLFASQLARIRWKIFLPHQDESKDACQFLLHPIYINKITGVQYGKASFHRCVHAWMTLNAPLGIPASMASSAKAKAVRGVISDGL